MSAIRDTKFKFTDPKEWNLNDPLIGRSAKTMALNRALSSANETFLAK